MSNHTPRLPLSLDSDGDILDAEGHLLAVIAVGGKSLTNVFLAAPDLLAALRLCVEWIEQDESTHGRAFNTGNLARAAIAKAEGSQ